MFDEMDSFYNKLSSSEHKEKAKKANAEQARSRHEEECQDVACSSIKKDMKNWMKNNPTKKDPECPLDRESLGKATWSVMHTVASKYSMRPTPKEKKDMEEFIRLMSIMYPCSYCAKDFREDIKQHPPQLESRKDLTLWFCQIHNKVNNKLGKPHFDCSKVDERWRTGWKDGSCL